MPANGISSFVAVMGGETAVGGKEVVVLMEKASGRKPVLTAIDCSRPQKRRRCRKSCGPPTAGFAVVGQTVFESAFGGRDRRDR